MLKRTAPAALLVSLGMLAYGATAAAAEEGDAAKKSAAAEDDAKDGAKAKAAPDAGYLIGARYRGILVPTFMQRLFADGGGTVYFNAVGPEIAIRNDRHMEVNLSAWLAFYTFNDLPFKGKSDPDTSWEILNSDVKLLYFTADFLWDQPLSPQWAIIYGLGVGPGFSFGNVERLQAFPQNGPPDDPNSYVPCLGPNNPPGGFCDPADNNRFPGNDERFEPSFFNGGAKPAIFPWITLQTGVRFKPVKEFAARLDLGFGTSGFLLGLGGDYAL